MKYRFEVLYSPPLLQEVVKLMKKVDFGFEDVGLTHILEFSSEKILTISEVKAHLIQAYEAQGNKILHIEGGSIE